MLFYVACKNVNPLHTHTIHITFIFINSSAHIQMRHLVLDFGRRRRRRSSFGIITNIKISFLFLFFLLSSDVAYHNGNFGLIVTFFFSHISVSFLTFYDEIIVTNASFHMKISNQNRKNITSVFLPSDANEFVFSFIAFFGSFTYQQTNKSENHWHSSMRPFSWELCHIVIFVVIKPYLEPFGFLNHYSRLFFFFFSKQTI